MTKFVHVNDHLIQVPNDVKVVSDGMWQYLYFKDTEICTIEEGEVDSEGVYVGPYFVTNPTTFMVDEFETLEAALEFIGN